jgi:hypothetical protein
VKKYPGGAKQKNNKSGKSSEKGIRSVEKRVKRWEIPNQRDTSNPYGRSSWLKVREEVAFGNVFLKM